MWRAESSNTRPGRSAGAPVSLGAPMPIATPCCTNMLAIVAMSARSGKLARISGSAVNRLAAISGSAAFLAPPILIVPDSGTPPWIRILSIAWLRAAMTAASGDGRSYPRAIPTGDAPPYWLLLRESPVALKGSLKPVARRRPPACTSGRRRSVRGCGPAPYGVADSRVARAPGALRARHVRSACRELCAGCRPSRRWKGRRAPLSISGAIFGQSRHTQSLVDAQADLGGENHRDGLPGGVFGGVVAMDAPPRLDPGAIARDRRQTGAARLLERVEHRSSRDIPGRINRRTVPYHYRQTRPANLGSQILVPRGAGAVAAADRSVCARSP